MTFRTRFLAAASAWTALVAGVIVALPLAASGRLPEPLATHWGPGGRPDDAMPVWALLAIALGMWCVIAGSCLAVAVRSGALRRRSSRVWLVAALAWGGVFVAGLMALTVWANLDASDWRAARPVSWQVVVLILAAFAIGWCGWLLGRTGPDDQPPARTPRTEPFLALRPDEHVVWVSSAGSPLLCGLSTAFLVSAAACAVLPLAGLPSWLWFAVGVAAAIGLAGLAVSSVRVQVTDAGLAIAFGPLRWPVRRVPLSRIEEAWVEDRQPSRVGGWGYRGLPGQATIMVRGGECLVVHYRAGGTLGISVDDARHGAALLNGLLGTRTGS